MTALSVPVINNEFYITWGERVPDEIRKDVDSFFVVTKYDENASPPVPIVTKHSLSHDTFSTLHIATIASQGSMYAVCFEGKLDNPDRAIVVYQIDGEKLIEKVRFKSQLHGDALSFLPVTTHGDWLYLAGYENGKGMVYGINLQTSAIKEKILPDTLYGYEYSRLQNFVFCQNDLYIFDINMNNQQLYLRKVGTLLES